MAKMVQAKQMESRHVEQRKLWPSRHAGRQPAESACKLMTCHRRTSPTSTPPFPLPLPLPRLYCVPLWPSSVQPDATVPRYAFDSRGLSRPRPQTGWHLATLMELATHARP